MSEGLYPSLNELSPPKEVTHKVQSADTILNIAMRYGVPVEEIKRRNKIQGNEIWMLNELVIPGTPASANGRGEGGDANVREPSGVPQQNVWGFRTELPSDVAEGARLRDHVTALMRAADCDEEVARTTLQKRDFDFDRALKEVTTVRRLAALFLVDDREALAYLDMCDFNFEAAKKALEDDLRWERDQESGARAQQRQQQRGRGWRLIPQAGQGAGARRILPTQQQQQPPVPGPRAAAYGSMQSGLTEASLPPPPGGSLSLSTGGALKKGR
uniref:LysM domain-containing protein n=1 Tax=Chromera velia CCMP2878 TaxID=1169474 RepID=A0A0G4I2A0_9ALVE|mmetsp:Transcript_30174/g.59236  ORF Transcript_30174/g.59236 Transcript_30174/m.59236 type:complete len:272 (+) Transcript_30174:207-1022(+)|eukprot:Cvel_1703.t1-p1 / transcript=Cvel_1703.t1 / gene=Cvel_1703 / organism=Chromera_velia_CCMP2878 / gene_product=hypothetical protein / transcript_product=hypothetical protein / location=Cvel_scaffold61:102459-104628(+) / protein_length=271 / sequence_SO=supercontig / SO=protein_coding / is_pseudo=false